MVNIHKGRSSEGVVVDRSLRETTDGRSRPCHYAPHGRMWWTRSTAKKKSSLNLVSEEAWVAKPAELVLPAGVSN